MSADGSQLSDAVLDDMLADHFSDWPAYTEFLDDHMEVAELSNILDVGGGAGLVSDSIIEHIPNAHVTLVDDSSLVLARNTPHDRKTLVQASALDLTTPLADRRFDLVIVNNLLHHLVGPSRQLTRENVVRCLGEMRQLLSADGRILIYETTYEGWWPGIDPGDLIYLLTNAAQLPDHRRR